MAIDAELGSLVGTTLPLGKIVLNTVDWTDVVVFERSAWTQERGQAFAAPAGFKRFQIRRTRQDDWRKVRDFLDSARELLQGLIDLPPRCHVDFRICIYSKDGRHTGTIDRTDKDHKSFDPAMIGRIVLEGKLYVSA